LWTIQLKGREIRDFKKAVSVRVKMSSKRRNAALASD
jgi:hypothetical protein